jgi:DNA-binding NtrC family response regulator
LRERAEDIPDLVGSFIRHFRSALGRTRVDGISVEALELLVRYPWPGNVRQLNNAIEHAVVVCRTARVSLADLPSSIVSPATATPPQVEPMDAQTPANAGDARWYDLPIREARKEVVREFERAYLDRLLRTTGGRIGRTAELAGMTARSLYDKLKLHGLAKDDYR